MSLYLEFCINKRVIYRSARTTTKSYPTNRSISIAVHWHLINASIFYYFANHSSQNHASCPRIVRQPLCRCGITTEKNQLSATSTVTFFGNRLEQFTQLHRHGEKQGRGTRLGGHVIHGLQITQLHGTGMTTNDFRSFGQFLGGL